MIVEDDRVGRIEAWRNRRAARSAWDAADVPGFVAEPDPKSIGSFARGRQIVAGTLVLGGSQAVAPGVRIWDMAEIGQPGFAADAQGFLWLDDLAAAGDGAARRVAQDWTLDWIFRFGRGQGGGWTPAVAGRRLVRLIHHATFLQSGLGADTQRSYLRTLGAHAGFLRRRWASARSGLPRIEALAGLVTAGLALIGFGRDAGTGEAALAEDCARCIGTDGAIASRNPEELLEIFHLLTWVEEALTEAGTTPRAEILSALERIAPTLRLLRHADGALARFHGGGSGLDGRLDRALASSGVRAGRLAAEAMGYHRLNGGRTSVIVDAAAPPGGTSAHTAHASTAAFELTSGRRAVIVSCGSGQTFGPKWRQAARATASHSALMLAGQSSSRFGKDAAAEARLDQRATVSGLRHFSSPEGQELHLAHDGWLAAFGVMAARRLLLRQDGRHLAVEDRLDVADGAALSRFDTARNAAKGRELAVTIRLHLHPEVDATLDMGGTAVSLQLRSGEIWVFRHDGGGRLALEPSAWLDRARTAPRPSRQIVLSAGMRAPGLVIGWTLAKAQDTPLAIRDLERQDAEVQD